MLENATNQAPPTRGGKLWRLLVGDQEMEELQSSPSSSMAPPALANQTNRPAPPVPAGVADRIDRLETGLRLMSEVLKRIHAELSGALSEVRSEVALTATSVDVRRTVAEALDPLTASIESLADTAHALPLTLGAMTERVTARIATLRDDLEETLIALIPSSWDSSSASPETTPETQSGQPDPDFWGR
jgi:hypothetical protein